MKRTSFIKSILVLIIAILIVQPVIPARAAPLYSGGISDVIPFLGLISSWFTRNRTYKSAEAFIADRRNNYDKQIASLDKALSEGTIYTPGHDSSPETQKAAYIRQVALLELERDMALKFAESIKNKARKDFNKAAREEIIKVVMSTNLAGRVLSAFDKGFSQAIKFTSEALTDVQRLRNTASQLQTLGGMIGGQMGQDLRDTLGNLIYKIDQQAYLTEKDLLQVKQDLTRIQNQIRDYQKMGSFPESSKVIDALALQLVGLGPGNASTEAILNILGIRSGKDKKSIRQSGLELLAAGQKARCREIVSKLLAALRSLEENTSDRQVAVETLCNELNAKSLKKEETKTAEEEPPVSEEEQPVTQEEPSQPAQDTSESVQIVGNWHGPACDEAEGTFAYRWSVDLIQDPQTDQLVGTIKFHACPGGGRVLYRVTGDQLEDGTLSLEGIRKEGAGDLFYASAENVTFIVNPNTGQISPNLAP